ncbi:MAG: F0F1 ATP synthase subunit B [Tissierellia bacterium]|nr:F0F1 ATP synthase subunit B [Tissierellia bacterium]
MDNLQITIVPDLLSLALQLSATLVLYFVLRHFLYNPIKEYMSKRQAYIENNILESEEAKQQALVLKNEYDGRMKNAKQEAGEIVATARVFGDDIKSKAIKESKEEADRIYRNGVKSLELERQKVMSSLNSDIVDMAMLGAEKVLKEKSSEKTDRRMVEDFVASLEATHE